MKYFYFLTLLLLWQSEQSVEAFLRYPQPLKTKVFEPEPNKTSFEISWNPVKNWDENDPIVGYRLVIWQMKYKFIYKEIDGKLQLAEDKDTGFTSTIPAGDPGIFEVSPDNLLIVYNNVKPEVWYEIAAMAYTKKEQGPLSPSVGIKVAGKNNTTT